VVATVGLSGPVDRVPKARLRVLGRAAMDAAQEVSVAIGASSAQVGPDV
jgi:DNA-binding IclR family transcriptional regulator